jgi:hypothetical protein
VENSSAHAPSASRRKKIEYYKMDNPSQLTLEVIHAGENTDHYSSCCHNHKGTLLERSEGKGTAKTGSERTNSATFPVTDSLSTGSMPVRSQMATDCDDCAATLRTGEGVPGTE